MVERPGALSDRLHPLTGTFQDAAVEDEFRAEHFDLGIAHFTRFSIALSTGVFLAYGLHDAYVLPELHERAWAIRYGVFGPLAFAVLALTFTRAYARLHQPAMFVFGMALNVVVLWIGALSPPAGFFIYTGYSILFVTLGPFIAKMNVVTQVAYTLASVALFVAFALGMSRPPLPVAVSIVATLASMGSIGALVARHLEVQAREAFLQRRTIRRQLKELNEERAKSEALLLNILPTNIAERLKVSGRAIADGFGEVTVLFADIVGFTRLSERLAPHELVSRLNELFSTFDDLADELGVEKIKTIGDAYMAVSGLNTQGEGQGEGLAGGRAAGHAQRMADMAAGMLARVAAFAERVGEPLSVRIGINTGPVVAGVIGKTKFIYDVWGDTVNTASRMESHGSPGRVHVTEATRACLGPGYDFEERGEIDIKGKGPMRTYYLGAAAAPVTKRATSGPGLLSEA